MTFIIRTELLLCEEGREKCCATQAVSFPLNKQHPCLRKCTASGHRPLTGGLVSFPRGASRPAEMVAQDGGVGQRVQHGARQFVLVTFLC